VTDVAWIGNGNGEATVNGRQDSDGRWLTVNEIVTVDGDGADEWQWQCARNQDGTGNAKVMEIGKRAATPSNSHDTKHQASA